MRRIYVDTGAWIALLWQRDRAHEAVAEHFRRLRESRDLLVTCDPVIGETITRLRYDAGLRFAMAFRSILEQATVLGSLTIRETDEALRNGALDLMQRYSDLTLSYADCIGAAIAREVDADAVFGLDNDFRILGLALEPRL